MMNKNNLEKIFAFLAVVNQLKFTYRYSTNKLLNDESTAAHTWRLMLFALLMKEELKIELDELKMLKIALIHDLAESLTGDIDSTLIAEGVKNQADKEDGEQTAMDKLKKMLPDNLGEEIYKYWQYYQDQDCLEAKIVKTLDKNEAQLHLLAKMPESFINESKADHCFHYADRAATMTPELKPLIDLIKEKFLEKGIKLSNQE